MRKTIILICLLVLIPVAGLAGGMQPAGGGFLVASAADVTAPELDSATINDDAAVITLTEDVTVTGLANGDFVMTGSTAGAVNLNSCSEDAGVISCTAASSFVNGETVTLAYTGNADDDIEDAAGNDLADFSGESVTNNTAAAGTNYLEDDFTSYSATDEHLGGTSGSPWVDEVGGTYVNVTSDKIVYDLEATVCLYEYNGDLSSANQWQCAKAEDLDNYMGFYFRGTGTMTDTAYAVRIEPTGWKPRDCEGASCTDWSGATNKGGAATEDYYYCVAVSGSGNDVIAELWEFASEPSAVSAGTDPQSTWGSPDQTWTDNPVQTNDNDGRLIGIYQGSAEGGAWADWRGGSW